MDVKTIQKIAAPILRKHHVSHAAVFGSAARNAMKKQSDVDLLVDFGKSKFGLFEVIHIKHALEKALHRKVDLVEYETLKPALRKKILAEQVAIL